MRDLSILEFLFLVLMGYYVCEVFIKSLLTCYKIRSGVYDKELDNSARLWSAHSSKAKCKCSDLQYETP